MHKNPDAEKRAMIKMITYMDLKILNMIQNNLRCRFLDRVFPKISMLGNFGAVWILSAVLLLLGKKYALTGKRMIYALALSAILCNLILKRLFARPRPFFADKSKKLLVKPPNDFSFPSGHTASSVASVIILWNTSYLFGIPAAILGFLILFSRMYLFLHYPSDIFGGIALGITVSYFILRVIPG